MRWTDTSSQPPAFSIGNHPVYEIIGPFTFAEGDVLVAWCSFPEGGAGFLHVDAENVRMWVPTHVAGKIPVAHRKFVYRPIDVGDPHDGQVVSRVEAICSPKH